MVKETLVGLLEATLSLRWSDWRLWVPIGMLVTVCLLLFHLPCWWQVKKAKRACVRLLNSPKWDGLKIEFISLYSGGELELRFFKTGNLFGVFTQKGWDERRGNPASFDRVFMGAIRGIQFERVQAGLLGLAESDKPRLVGLYRKKRYRFNRGINGGWVISLE